MTVIAYICESICALGVIAVAALFAVLAHDERRKKRARKAYADEQIVRSERAMHAELDRIHPGWNQTTVIDRTGTNWDRVADIFRKEQ